MLCLAAALGRGGRLSAAEPGNDVIDMIVGLVSEKDKDLRAVGLQQVREEAKGPAATKRFAELLPKLLPDAQAGLLDALGDRGDATARPAVLEMLKSTDAPVRAAALRAIGALGQPADVPLLVKSLAAAAGPEQAAAGASLVRLQGPTINAAIVAELKGAAPDIRVKLAGVLADRRATDTVPSLLAAAQGDDAKVRAAAMTALAELAGPEQVPELIKAVLKAQRGAEREAAEKDVMLVCSRIEDPAKRADPLLAAMAKLSQADQTALLSLAGRVGGPGALKTVEAAIADKSPQRRDAGMRALCNWPDASVAPRLLELAKNADSANHRAWALRALIRVAALPDKRPDAEKLDLLKKAMSLCTRDEDRALVLKRASAIRTIESLRFVLPYLDKPTLAQQACATVVDLAHHRGLREPNKAEFDPALDAVIRTAKDPGVVDRATRYKKGQT